MNQELLFGVGPYGALVLALVGILIRFAIPLEDSIRTFQRRQSRLLLWSSPAWKVGAMVILGGHLLPVFLPQHLLSWNDDPLRLLLLEALGFGFGGLAFAGLWIGLRRTQAKGRSFGPIDTIVAALLLTAVGSGLLVAVLYRWGSTWSVTLLVPYLKSIVTLSPQGELAASLPLLARIHFLSAMGLISIAPISSLGAFFSRTLAPRTSVART
jgi:nitrate reductase gamma subunit